MLILLRLLYAALLAVMIFLALTPGTWGMVISSGEQRHTLAFAILPVLSCIAWPAFGPVTQFLFYAALGGGIELTQAAMHVGRKAEWTDWFIDLAVTALALAIATLAVYAVARLREGQRNRVA